MQELKERILREGRNLGNGILKVDGFVNHQVDPLLMDKCGQEFARRFNHLGPTNIVIDECLASGATIPGLVRLAVTAGATIVGVGALIEKTFEGGREALAHLRVPIESLASIRLMEGDK